MALDALKEAIKIAGGQTMLAYAIRSKYPHLKVRQGHIGNWLRSPNPDLMPPAEYVIPIEEASGVAREDLRPDLYR